MTVNILSMISDRRPYDFFLSLESKEWTYPLPPFREDVLVKSRSGAHRDWSLEVTETRNCDRYLIGFIFPSPLSQGHPSLKSIPFSRGIPGGFTTPVTDRLWPCTHHFLNWYSFYSNLSI